MSGKSLIEKGRDEVAHFIIDGSEGDYKKLASEEAVRTFLNELPGKIGLTEFTPPFVQEYHGAEKGDWGYSGFIPLAGSHLSVHTFPERGLLWADIFSVIKEVDKNEMVALLRRIFGLKQVRLTELRRGQPKQIVEQEGPNS